MRVSAFSMKSYTTVECGFQLLPQKLSGVLLDRTLQYLYQVVTGLSAGLVIWLCVNLLISLIDILSSQIPNNEVNVPFIKQALFLGWLSLGLGLICTFIGGIRVSIDREIKVFEKLSWSWLAVVYGASCGASFGLIAERLSGGCVGMIAGLCISVVVLFSELNSENIEVTVQANQGILKSAKNAGFVVVALAFITGIIITVGSIFCTGQFWQSPVTFVAGSLIGFIASLTAGWKFGGKVCIQHFALRSILHRNNFIPWNYARFLNYATERLFLQRVGGRYRFIHKLLQEHFAKMEVSDPLREEG